eukprot:TRINITY_DN4170_c0_g1_i1.p1 TRINITY_DN4170_c0_g1~~TRINITY_DN4170_c0_g1_i1.p1  ORF type:complete len:1390 (-),score=218.40 TRINITY_DN4170_c0_g1_i1:202-4371(-)
MALMLDSSASQQLVDDPTNPLTELPAPAFSFLFKQQVRKHLHICWKRKRWVSVISSSVIYGGAIVGIYFALRPNSDTVDSFVYKLITTTLYPLFLALAINSAFSTGYVEIISEKESKMKIVQNVYGLTDANYWLSFLVYFVILSLPCIVIFIVCCYVITPIFRPINIVIVLLTFLLAFIQQFLVVAVGSVFFDTVKTAQSVMGLISVLLVEGASALMLVVQGQGMAVQSLVGLVPIVNVIQALNALSMVGATFICTGEGDSRHCENGQGLKGLFVGEGCFIPYDDKPGLSLKQSCQQAGPSGLVDSQFGVYKEFVSPGVCVLMMVVATAFFSFVTWWLDSIWQGEFGTAKPMCFCMNPAFICPKRQVSCSTVSTPGDVRPFAALSIRNLRKEFPRGKVAVDNMNLEMHGGEIFAMLGHNGAGKTTAINCIMGLIPPTSGGAVVNGYDIHNNINAARRQLSICPQDNPIYVEFTVRQHLSYFSSLRGVPESQVSERIGKMLSALGLSEKVDELCKSLSGGQKRRLWVATALLGESPICFLDEPTSGMDAAARRELWDILISIRASGRCVIFTTHYLEEADLLADRKCVLARGAVQAVGTSRELKHQFGIGYHLVVEMTAAGRAQDVEQLVMAYVAQATKETVEPVDSAQAVDQAAVHVERFAIPFSEMDHCGPMLSKLEDLRHEMGVRDYTLETSSLEEVFMVLGQKAEEHRQEGAPLNVDFGVVQRENIEEGNCQERSSKRNVSAMICLKLAEFKHNRRATFYGIFFPCVFLVLAIYLPTTSSNSSSNSFAIALYPSLAFGIATLGSVATVLRDRETKVRFVMMAQGVKPWEYWVGTILSCSINLVFVSVVFMISYILMTPPGVGNGPTLMVAMMAAINPINLLLFGFNVASLFQSAEIAMKGLPMLFMLLGMVPCAGVWILISAVKTSVAYTIANVIHCVFSLINPIYAFGGMLIYVTQKYTEGGDGQLSWSGSFASWGAIPLYAAPVVSFVLGLNLVRIEIRNHTKTPGTHSEFESTKKDDDVLAEERRIEAGLTCVQAEAVRYQGLSHTYREKVQGEWRETHAVRGISLGIRSGECFGLLGPNGAGKTTTLAVLTGEVRPPTAGYVTICGHDMSTTAGVVEAYKLLGVCPQVDPLIADVPGRDQLLFFGRIKGVPEAQLECTVDKLLQRLGLEAFDAAKVAGSYSGGMKRKLSVGISLIGHPPVLFMDEPTAAVDAGAKRHLWKVIKNRALTQTVVLTTHSMEEAEALCDRLAIQVKGQLRCLGTPMSIRNKYGFGYQLEIFASPPADAPGLDRAASRSWTQSVQDGPSQKVLDFVLGSISCNAKLLEFHGDRYLFQLPALSEELTLGYVLTQITTNKAAIGMIEWSIQRPTLEQVFLRFAKEQDH